MAKPSRQGGEQNAVAMHAEKATLGMVQSFSFSIFNYYIVAISVRKACARINCCEISLRLCKAQRYPDGSASALTSHVVLGPAGGVVVSVLSFEDA